MMIARARRSRSWRSGSATEVWCRTCSCFIGLLHCFILREEPENGETELSARLPLQLLHLGLDYQVNRFMGCDCHIENFIKDFKRALPADRLSCSTFAANFFRLLEHAAAYVLVHALRTQVAPLAPQLGRAKFDPPRVQLLKVAAIVSQSTRRLLVRLPFAFPLARVFRQLATMLAGQPAPSAA